ncbi:MAG: phosphopantetheine-binding protein [Scytonema sp. PMC 1069.18]|nr:phosphopantetheine-binding protein [Scytonema sp. PMC 1069.18]MEC4883812.1 phosphopantetheine-binding protein [Scytonema sp. PMC 1070.18]
MRGRDRNELTQFRYNVILHIGGENLDKDENSSVLNWSEDNLTVSAVRQLLIENQPEILYINNVPNARVMAAVKTAEWLSDVEGFKTVGQMRKALQELENLGVEPEDFYTLDVPYTVEMTWSASSMEGRYDVVFVRQERIYKKTIFPHNTTHSRSWQSYANNPLQAKAARKLVPQLQTYIAQKLPEYMMPSALVVLESFPLTANGKVNRRALRAFYDAMKTQLPESYIAPRTPVEQVMMKIFVEVLGLRHIGIYDNFFELGGHSLLATQLISRVRDALRVELPLRSVFEAPTVAQISQVVESLKETHAQSQAPVLAPLSRESRRMKLSSFNQQSKEH